MSLGRNMLKFVLLIANLLVAALMLLTLFSSHVSPQKFLLPAYLGLILPLTILLNIAFIVLWLFARKWHFLISLIVLALSFNALRAVFPINFPGKEQVEVENSFTLMSYNTHANNMMSKHTTENPNPIMQYLLEKDPDILCIQEYLVSYDENHLTESDVKKIFKKYPYQHIQFQGASSWATFGIATFSKFPILKRTKMDFESQNNLAMYTDIDVQGNMIRLFNCHMESNKLTEGDLIQARELATDPANEDIKGTTLHISRKLGSAYRIRAGQADLIADSIAASPYTVLVAGDFNDVPASYVYTKIRGDMKDAFVTKGTGLGWTFTQHIFRFRIDHVFYDSALQLHQFKIDKDMKVSDHYPLIATFNFK